MPMFALIKGGFIFALLLFFCRIRSIKTIFSSYTSKHQFTTLAYTRYGNTMYVRTSLNPT